MAGLRSADDLIKYEEGEKASVYQDSLGFWTIADGICVDSRKGCGLWPEEIDFLRDNRINAYRRELSKEFPWFPSLDPVREAVVLSMRHQVGELRLWPKFCDAMAKQDHYGAAREMLDSKVARTQTPERWRLQAKMMESGEWPNNGAIKMTDATQPLPPAAEPTAAVPLGNGAKSPVTTTPLAMLATAIGSMVSIAAMSHGIPLDATTSTLLVTGIVGAVTYYLPHGLKL